MTKLLYMLFSNFDVVLRAGFGFQFEAFLPDAPFTLC